MKKLSSLLIPALMLMVCPNSSWASRYLVSGCEGGTPFDVAVSRCDVLVEYQRFNVIDVVKEPVVESRFRIEVSKLLWSRAGDPGKELVVLADAYPPHPLDAQEWRVPTAQMSCLVRGPYGWREAGRYISQVDAPESECPRRSYVARAKIYNLLLNPKTTTLDRGEAVAAWIDMGLTDSGFLAEAGREWKIAGDVDLLPVAAAALRQVRVNPKRWRSIPDVFLNLSRGRACPVPSLYCGWTIQDGGLTQLMVALLDDENSHDRCRARQILHDLSPWVVDGFPFTTECSTALTHEQVKKILPDLAKGRAVRFAWGALCKVKPLARDR